MNRPIAKSITSYKSEYFHVPSLFSSIWEPSQASHPTAHSSNLPSNWLRVPKDVLFSNPILSAATHKKTIKILTGIFCELEADNRVRVCRDQDGSGFSTRDIFDSVALGNDIFSSCKYWNSILTVRLLKTQVQYYEQNTFWRKTSYFPSIHDWLSVCTELFLSVRVAITWTWTNACKMSTAVESLCIMMLKTPFLSTSKYFAEKTNRDN